MVAPGSNNDELDPISFWVLLLLSGGQRFTFNDLVKSINQPIDSVWEALNILQQRKFARNENLMFIIDFEGVLYLTKRGILAAEAEKEPQPKDFKNKYKPPFFTSWTDLLTWLAVPLLLLIPTIIIASFLISESIDIFPGNRINQYGAWLLYFGFVILYLMFSYHYTMDTERLVVFRSGKPIGKKGPGHVLTLPFIDHIKTVDLREKSLEIKKEPCLTSDNILVNAGLYVTWQVEDPITSLTKVSKIEDSMSLLCASALRTSIVQFTMEDALGRQPALNTLIRTRIEHKTEGWGVQVNDTELRELEPPEIVVKQLENRFNAQLESEAVIRRSDAQIQTLRNIWEIGRIVDDRTLNIFNTLINNTKSNNIPNTLDQEIPKSTKEFLANHPEFDLLHVELSLPNLIPITEYFERTEKTIKSIDFIYSFFTILNNGAKENISELIDLFSTTNADQTNTLSNTQLHNILHKANIPPLLISSIKYASPEVGDFLGIGKTLEIVSGIIKDVIWRGKYERKIADIDIRSKENDLERSILENQKLQLELVEKQIELIEKGKNIKLSKKEKELLLSAIGSKIEFISISDINPALLSVKKEKGLLPSKEPDTDNNKLPEGEE